MELTNIYNQKKQSDNKRSDFLSELLSGVFADTQKLFNKDNLVNEFEYKRME